MIKLDDNNINKVINQATGQLVLESYIKKSKVIMN